MSTLPEPTEGTRATDTPHRRRRSFQPRAILVVALAWCLLWDRISWGNVLSGLVVGLLVTLAFPLPSIEFGGRLRLPQLLVLLSHFFRDLAVASVQVAILAFRSRPPRNSVIEVKLRTHSDFYLTLTSELVGLVPGSTVIEARRSSSIIYLHLLDVWGQEATKHFHDHVLEIEERVVRVFGSPGEIATVERLKKEGR
ncbi:MAG TPA: Na+/H+ antiporter subunit E [Intrasporangium sp.]|uniref:Na+/H+ antiporter subunit E n=1 Tax=Intrasporangium sp. TaxID=1925024 RepID=UPI002B4A9682|nr:Na+/H+ antiporter subunit E [Intrasporangium sp.]HKX65987.1 Na+/H+ antiporter subunit E [Intrasporangium sp.]